jgi:hypothetical protein
VFLNEHLRSKAPSVREREAVRSKLSSMLLREISKDGTLHTRMEFNVCEQEMLAKDMKV